MGSGAEEVVAWVPTATICSGFRLLIWRAPGWAWPIATERGGHVERDVGARDPSPGGFADRRGAPEGDGVRAGLPDPPGRHRAQDRWADDHGPGPGRGLPRGRRADRRQGGPPAADRDRGG